MKLRDSGMPDELYWETLFDVNRIVAAMRIDSRLRDVAELGCGYGTFTIPVARRISGTLYTSDIEPAMVARTKERVEFEQVTNVVCQQRDVAEQGFGLRPGSVDAVLLFNILHCEDPLAILRMSAKVVAIGGWVLAIHWRFDSQTPRGPSLEIRPQPEQVVACARRAGLTQRGGTIDLPPWHYGLQFELSGEQSSGGG